MPAIEYNDSSPCVLDAITSVLGLVPRTQMTFVSAAIRRLMFEVAELDAREAAALAKKLRSVR